MTVPRWSLLALRVGIAAVLGGSALHALLSRQSVAVAGVELLGAAVLLVHARAGAALLLLSLGAAFVVHREIPPHLVVPALGLIALAAART